MVVEEKHKIVTNRPEREGIFVMMQCCARTHSDSQGQRQPKRADRT